MFRSYETKIDYACIVHITRNIIVRMSKYRTGFDTFRHGFRNRNQYPHDTDDFSPVLPPEYRAFIDGLERAKRIKKCKEIGKSALMSIGLYFVANEMVEKIQ